MRLGQLLILCQLPLEALLLLLTLLQLRVLLLQCLSALHQPLL